MLNRGRPRAVLLALIAAWVLPASAQLLNSERIEQTFGSYGITVLYSDAELRISDLYSVHAGQRVTRTLAIVGYPRVVGTAFAAEHETVLAGGSIGTTFRDAGWEVIKTGHSYFGTALPAKVAAAMQVADGTIAAAHAYRLDISRDGRVFEYVVIIEIHHPDYLRHADLPAIYGPEQREALPAATGRLLAAGMAGLERPGLTLGE